MKVAFLTFPVPGHAYPMSSLARRLKSRGHDVVVIGTPDAAPVKELTVPRLTLLINEVLRNPEYRQKANRLRQAIANTNGLEKAVDLLE